MRSLLLVALVLASPALSAPGPGPAKPAADSALDRCLAQSPGSAPGITHVTDCYRAAQIRVDAALAAANQAQLVRLKGAN